MSLTVGLYGIARTPDENRKYIYSIDFINTDNIGEEPHIFVPYFDLQINLLSLFSVGPLKIFEETKRQTVIGYICTK